MQINYKRYPQKGIYLLSVGATVPVKLMGDLLVKITESVPLPLLKKVNVILCISRWSFAFITIVHLRSDSCCLSTEKSVVIKSRTLLLLL